MDAHPNISARSEACPSASSSSEDSMDRLRRLNDEIASKLPTKAP